MIGLEEEHYNGHTKDHPNDAYLLNKPIQNYKEMVVIFGNGQATGKWAMGSNEPLGTPSDCAESSMKTEVATELTSSGKAHPSDTAKAEIASGSKRKRSMLGEDDVVVLGAMSEAVKEVASAIRETKVEDCHPDLYGAIMFIPGFTEEALMCAYGHLLDNKALGTSFVQWSNSHRMLWLRTHLAKHYYI